MRPPIFSPHSVGDTPQDYMHRARQFREAAMSLPDYKGGEQFWPKYALLTHAIELALKAYVRHSAFNRNSVLKQPKQHDLSGWYQLALQYGLTNEPGVADNIDLLNELHFNHYSRYPQNRSRPIPDASVIADSTVDALMFAFTQVINPR